MGRLATHIGFYRGHQNRSRWFHEGRSPCWNRTCLSRCLMIVDDVYVRKFTYWWSSQATDWFQLGIRNSRWPFLVLLIEIMRYLHTLYSLKTHDVGKGDGEDVRRVGALQQICWEKQVQSLTEIYRSRTFDACSLMGVYWCRYVLAHSKNSRT